MDEIAPRYSLGLMNVRLFKFNICNTFCGGWFSHRVPPDVQVKIDKTTVNEHEFVQFECATSVGHQSEIISRYQWLWMKSGSTAEQVIQDAETSTQNGKLFEFVRIPYDRSGTYTCKAWNLGGMGQASAVLTVHFSPRIDPEANMTYDVVGEIGKEASFELFIIANPTPATTGYVWSKDDNILSNSSSEYEIISGPTSSKLAIEHVKSSDYGNYTCPVKTSGFQTKVFKFKLLKPVPPDVQVKISKTTVNEHEFVRFECATSGGYPDHIERYQWLWKKSGSTAEQVIQDSETSTQNGKLFEFVRIPYDRSGTYSCKAWNLGGMGQTSAVLTVHFSPRIDPEASSTYDVVGKIGKEASFELFIIANPTPATTGYVWSKDDNILSNSSSEYEIISGPTSSKLAIEHVKSSHYGNYTCSVKTSGFQAKVFKFKLFKPGPPSAPSKLEVVNSTAVAATLKWISEINGGSEQRFYVQYKKFADNWDVAPEVPQGGMTDPGLKRAVYHKIMGLESDVGYMFRVRSRNSHTGTHTSNFSNVASGETPEKPKTSLKGVNRIGKKVTVGWERVTGKYTGLKIKYCQTGTVDCMTHTVPKQEDTYVTFVVDPDKSYYYYMVVEDGGDVVYRSRVFNDEVDDKTSIAAVGGLVGAGIVAITGVVLAVILWKRGLLRWRKRQCHRPANDNADYDDTRVEFTADGKPQVHIYAKIETDHVNDVFDREHWHGQKPPQPLPTGHRVPVHGAHRNEPAESDDDVDADVGAYDYATWQQGVPGQRLVPAPQQNQTECGSSDDESGEYILSDPISDQEGQEPEGTYNDLPIFVTDAQKELRIHKDAQPDQSTAESSSRQGIGSNERTPSRSNGAQEMVTSRSNDNMGNEQGSLYAHLDPAAPVPHGEYLDFRQLSSE
ncbi:contactin-5-like [Lineus longissimus]|uniref:contactin-5-like n=1 Tax=Lineus longissimus TaxID=88925 RepID=UPI00315D9D92